MNPDHPLAMSEPANAIRPSGRRASAWWVVYHPGRWIAHVPRENSSPSQSLAVGGHDLVPRDDVVELALNRGQVRGVARPPVDPESDHHLLAAGEQVLGRQVPERMRRA